MEEEDEDEDEEEEHDSESEEEEDLEEKEHRRKRSLDQYSSGPSAKRMRYNEMGESSKGRQVYPADLDEDVDDCSDDEDHAAGPAQDAEYESERAKRLANEYRPNEQHVHVIDESLSDRLVYAFGSKTQQLDTLILSGCNITDKGLQEIIRQQNLPALKYLDVTNTRVTPAAVTEARQARPECLVLAGRLSQGAAPAR